MVKRASEAEPLPTQQTKVARLRKTSHTRSEKTQLNSKKVLDILDSDRKKPLIAPGLRGMIIAGISVGSNTTQYV